MSDIIPAQDLGYQHIGQWFRFAHEGYERYGQLTEVKATRAYSKDKPPYISVGWETADKLRGYATHLDAEQPFTPVDPPQDN